MEKDVHTEHCCSVHGCKYASAACTVADGSKSPSFPCWMCEQDEQERNHWIARLREEGYTVTKEGLP